MKKSFEYQLGPEAEKSKQELTQSLEESQLEIAELKKYLETEIDYLQVCIFRVRNMEGHNEIIDDLKIDQEIKINEEKDRYSKEDIDLIEKTIEEINRNIENTKDHIALHHISTEACRAEIEKFNDLENEFKALLLTIRPGQRQ